MNKKITLAISALAATPAWADTAQQPLPAPPTITKVTALPMGWLVYFQEPAQGGPYLNFVAIDPGQKWLSTTSGSPHRQSRSPLFVQGAGVGGASAQFVLYAQSANGWSKPSKPYSSVATPGKLPGTAEPYVIYDGTKTLFNWSGDFSWPGGDANCIPPAFGGTGNPPNPNTVDIAWFDSSVPGIDGGTSIRIDSPVTGNFAPAIPANTLTIPPAVKFFSLAIQPDYSNADFSLVFEGVNDLDVSKQVMLSKYVAEGKFAPGKWNRVNVPVSDLQFSAPLYKPKIQQKDGTQGLYHISSIRFTAAPQ